MYTLYYQPDAHRDAVSLFGLRFTPTTFGTGAVFLLALGALHLVPWQADEAASRGLAQLLKSGSAPRTLIAAAPVAPAMTPAPAVVAAAPAPVAEPEAPSVQQHVIKLDGGQNLAAMLQELGMVAEEAKAAMNAVRDVFDVRRLKAGQEFQVTVRHDGNSRNLLGLNFLINPTQEIKVERDQSGTFNADAIKVPTSRQRLAAGGEIKNGLYDAAEDAGIPRDVARDMVKMFSHTVDFQRDVHPGDKFRVVYNQDVTEKGVQVGNSDIVYAAIESAGKMKQLYRYEYDKGEYDYFDENGRTVRRALLRTPVERPRVTSGFGVRVHPVLGFSKMHEGTDFGSPAGSPIYAAGDGVVEQAGWFSAYGRYVKIRHTNSMETAYGHMSGFASNLKAGAKVKQGQVIGYVGSTGRATGPHLHYEVIVNNRKVNPMGVNMDAGRNLSGRQLTTFKTWRDKVQSDFVAQQGTTPGPIKLASNTASADKNN